MVRATEFLERWEAAEEKEERRLSGRRMAEKEDRERRSNSNIFTGYRMQKWEERAQE